MVACILQTVTGKRSLMFETKIKCTRRENPGYTPMAVYRPSVVNYKQLFLSLDIYYL